MNACRIYGSWQIPRSAIEITAPFSLVPRGEIALSRRDIESATTPTPYSSVEEYTEMASATQTRKPRLMDQMRQVMRVKHYSYQTENSYLHWARGYILFHDKRHPSEWKLRRCGHSFHIWPWIATSRHLHRTRRSMPLFFFTSTCLKWNSVSSMRFVLGAQSDRRSCSP
jgi:hypothetical protein